MLVFVRLGLDARCTVIAHKLRVVLGATCGFPGWRLVVSGARLSGHTPVRPVGAKLARDGGLIADLALLVVHLSDLWEQSLLARRPYSRPVFL